VQWFVLFKIFFRNMVSAIPDLHMHVVDTIVDGNKASVRVVVRGTHSGEGLGVSAGGRGISIAGIVIVRILDGQIVEGWNGWDQLGLLRQIGAIPGPPLADRFLSSSG
jgi:predicted ester cyclase